MSTNKIESIADGRENKLYKTMLYKDSLAIISFRVCKISLTLSLKELNSLLYSWYTKKKWGTVLLTTWTVIFFWHLICARYLLFSSYFIYVRSLNKVQ